MPCFVFFKQKTAYEVRISDWSSDVCSSVLKHTGDGRECVIRSTSLDRHLDEMRIGVACRGGRLRLVLIKADRARRIARGLIRYVDGDALPVIGEACLIDHHCARLLRGPGACQTARQQV